MKRLLIIGCGNVGLRVALLLRARHRIYALTHSAERFADLRRHGLMPLLGDLDQPDTLAGLCGLAHDVIHLVPPPPRGQTDTRTAHLIAALGRGRSLPQHFIYISTSGVYGDCQGALIDETRLINPQSRRALRRADAERRVRAWGRRNGANVSILRVPGIYAADRLPLARLSQRTPVIVSEEDSYTNHIHADDLARIVVAALRHAKPGRIYHACADSNLRMGEYFDLVADHFGLPKPERIARAQAERGQVSPSMYSFMRESRRLMNQRIKHELYVSLRYPTVSDGLACSVQD